jgi:hypothetical protein
MTARSDSRFGGIAFMLEGSMCCGIVGDRLEPRLGADLAERALERPHVSPMDLAAKLSYSWVEQAAGFTRTLPPKPRAGSGARD